MGGSDPHADRAWAKDFLLELRLIGVETSVIRSTFLDVVSRCGQSGVGPQLMFGNPAAYARSLQLPAPAYRSRGVVARSLAPTVVWGFGLLTATWSFYAFSAGDQLEISTGHLATGVFFVAEMAALVWFGDQVRRLIAHHQTILVVASVAGTAVFVVVLESLVTVVWRVGAEGALAASMAAMVGGATWAMARSRAHKRAHGSISG
jgi:hypothetical protein